MARGLGRSVAQACCAKRAPKLSRVPSDLDLHKGVVLLREIGRQGVSCMFCTGVSVQNQARALSADLLSAERRQKRVHSSLGCPILDKTWGARMPVFAESGAREARKPAGSCPQQ